MELAGASASPQRPNSKLRSLICQRSRRRSCTLIIRSKGSLWSYLQLSSCSLRRAAVTDWSYKTTHHLPRPSSSLCRTVQRTHVERDRLWPDAWVAAGLCSWPRTQQGKRIGSSWRVCQSFPTGPLLVRSSPCRDEWIRTPMHLLVFAWCNFFFFFLHDDHHRGNGNGRWCLIPHTHPSSSHRARAASLPDTMKIKMRPGASACRVLRCNTEIVLTQEQYLISETNI